MLGVWLIQCPRLSFLLLLMLLYVHGDRWLGEQGDELRLTHKLQALVYEILPLEEGAGKRCSESVCWYQFLSLSLQFHMHLLTSSSVIAASKVQEFCK